MAKGDTEDVGFKEDAHKKIRTILALVQEKGIDVFRTAVHNSKEATLYAYKNALQYAKSDAIELTQEEDTIFDECLEIIQEKLDHIAQERDDLTNEMMRGMGYSSESSEEPTQQTAKMESEVIDKDTFKTFALDVLNKRGKEEMLIQAVQVFVMLENATTEDDIDDASAAIHVLRTLPSEIRNELSRLLDHKKTELGL
ncbi:MAG: hypothetical protein COU32_00850 [Candidatus Magasanikbacteria bacterium CG10_big_fil_rev_8_21_14_0_10_42_10]|uniref:Uncharacterized protein n=2 Tax=Candidatus Magasanikiibacteriota TaxID=1752731 RepID=A0A2H0TWZ5_9BACT|nr:MAG: hypothetical protein COU32_00850 [Candidatus Magasanikbacteria bacterium CG10_big_fil_rev_8_21_14_0_10_42_10]